MTAQWTDDYRIGDETIDSHHQEIFHMISSIDSITRSNSRDRIDEVIRFLESHMVEHFAEEEDLMAKNNYSEIEFHKREHEIFKMRILELRQQYASQTPNAHIIFSLRRFVDRLVDHITTVDSRMSKITGGES